jgi:hypothetical protein
MHRLKPTVQREALYLLSRSIMRTEELPLVSPADLHLTPAPEELILRPNSDPPPQAEVAKLLHLTGERQVALFCQLHGIPLSGDAAGVQLRGLSIRELDAASLQLLLASEAALSSESEDGQVIEWLLS